MSIITDVEDKVKGWVFTVALGKGVASAAKLIVSWAIAHGISLVVSVGGVAINTTDEAAMVIAINSGLKIVFNWMKVKWPALSWLP